MKHISHNNNKKNKKKVCSKIKFLIKLKTNIIKKHTHLFYICNESCNFILVSVKKPKILLNLKTDMKNARLLFSLFT